MPSCLKSSPLTFPSLLLPVCSMGGRSQTKPNETGRHSLCQDSVVWQWHLLHPQKCHSSVQNSVSSLQLSLAHQTQTVSPRGGDFSKSRKQFKPEQWCSWKHRGRRWTPRCECKNRVWRTRYRNSAYPRGALLLCFFNIRTCATRSGGPAPSRF